MLFHRFLLLSLSVLLAWSTIIAPTGIAAANEDKDNTDDDGDGAIIDNNPDDDKNRIDDILFAAQPCPAECTDPEQLQRRRERGGARIFYLLLIHSERTQNDAVHLFRAVRDPRNIVVVHYDTDARDLLLDDDSNSNSNSNRLRHEMETCPCGSAVRLESVHTVEWSRWSMNLPTLWGLQVAVDDYSGQWDTFVNLSGDTMAVYAANAMAELLHELGRYNFVTSRSCETGLLPTSVYHFPAFWHKRRHYTRDETEPAPLVLEYLDDQGRAQNKTVTIHFGSQWLILQRDFCAWLVQQLDDDHPHSWPSQLRDYLQTSGFLMTDETFLPTVFVHADDFADTRPVFPLRRRSNGTLLSGLHHVRYERMDEHYPTPFGVFPEHQHYRVPDHLLPVIPQPRDWGPYFLGVYDLGGIRDAGALYCRKVSAYIDDNLVRLLPVDGDSIRDNIPDIRWHPAHEISLTARPDWSAERAQWRELVERRKQRGDDEANNSGRPPLVDGEDKGDTDDDDDEEL